MTSHSELVEKVARLVDPYTFKFHDSTVSNLLKNGDDKSEAEECANFWHGKRIREAKQTADEIRKLILAVLMEPNDDQITTAFTLYGIEEDRLRDLLVNLLTASPLSGGE